MVGTSASAQAADSAERPPASQTPERYGHITDTGPRPTLAWLATQLVPSPSLWFGADDKLGLRDEIARQGQPRVSLSWQVTPVLYSFGLNRRVSPWRFLVAEPLARYGGSIEMHVSPEWFVQHPGGNLFFRTGARVTLPLHQHGEYVALSFGSSYARFDGTHAAIYEGGIHLLFGTVGLVFSHSPSVGDLRYGLRLNLRYF